MSSTGASTSPYIAWWKVASYRNACGEKYHRAAPRRGTILLSMVPSLVGGDGDDVILHDRRPLFVSCCDWGQRSGIARLLRLCTENDVVHEKFISEMTLRLCLCGMSRYEKREQQCQFICGVMAHETVSAIVTTRDMLNLTKVICYRHRNSPSPHDAITTSYICRSDTFRHSNMGGGGSDWA